MSDKEQKPTPPPTPLKEVVIPKPGGEIKENTLPTFHNPPPPPPPPPKSSDNSGS